MRAIARLLDVLLQAVTIVLLVVLAVVVVAAVAFRYTGNSLIWYDEIASILLAWLTFIGAGLAALRNAHLGFNGLVLALPPGPRLVAFVVVEAVFVATFAVTAWASAVILPIFGTEALVSLPWISLAATKAVLPATAGVIVLARLLTLPERYRQTRAGVDPEALEIEAEIARAGVPAASREGSP